MIEKIVTNLDLRKINLSKTLLTKKPKPSFNHNTHYLGLRSKIRSLNILTSKTFKTSLSQRHHHKTPHGSNFLTLSKTLPHPLQQSTSCPFVVYTINTHTPLPHPLLLSNPSVTYILLKGYRVI